MKKLSFIMTTIFSVYAIASAALAEETWKDQVPIEKAPFDCIKAVCDFEDGLRPFPGLPTIKKIMEIKEVFLDSSGVVKACSLGEQNWRGGAHLTFCSNLMVGDVVTAHFESFEYYDGFSKAPRYKEILLYVE